MNSIIVLLSLLASTPTWARHDAARSCEFELSSPEVRPSRVTFSSRVTGLKPNLREALIDGVNRQGLSLVENVHGRLTGMVFDERPGKKDVGYFVNGRLTGDHFIVDQVVRRVNGYNHYRRLAQARGLSAFNLSLTNPLLRCPNLTVSGAAQVKIPLKHRLALEDVYAFLSTTGAAPVTFPHESRALYTITDTDARGRRIEVMIEESDECPNELITAYVVQ